MKNVLIVVITGVVTLGLLIYAGRKPVEQPPAGPPVVNVPPVEPARTISDAVAVITPERTQSHMRLLAGPAFEGRMSGQSGNEKAAAFIKQEFQRIGVLPAVNGGYEQAFQIQNMNTHKEPGNGRTANLVGYLPGQSEETIVVGAHMDHIGYGPRMSQTPARREIHFGADDNASGTTALLQIAEGFATMKGQLRHRVVFVAFSGEEMGLIGANFYVAHPVVPLNKTFFMLNMDMIGRSRGQVSVLGGSSIPAVAKTAQELGQKYRLQVKLTKECGGGSDQAAFQRKGVPSVFIHTGTHSQYHTPEDTVDRIDMPGLTGVGRFTFELCWKMGQVGRVAQEVYSIPDRPFTDHELPDR